MRLNTVLTGMCIGNIISVNISRSQWNSNLTTKMNQFKDVNITSTGKHRTYNIKVNNGEFIYFGDKNRVI